MILIIFIIIGLGLLLIISPETGWKISYGWKFKNAEPSNLALVVQRISGVILIVLAVVLFFVAINEFGIETLLPFNINRIN